VCEAVAPKFFSVDHEGSLTILQDEVADSDEAALQAAALGCPVAALKVT
jgi:ferredoxin